MYKTEQTEGTGFKIAITTTYRDLVQAFGEPHKQGSADGKTQAEWAFRLGSTSSYEYILLNGKQLPRRGVIANTVFTIYDYKMGMPVEEVTEWNLGGKNGDALGIGMYVVDVITKAGGKAVIAE